MVYKLRKKISTSKDVQKFETSYGKWSFTYEYNIYDKKNIVLNSLERVVRIFHIIVAQGAINPAHTARANEARVIVIVICHK